MRNGSDLPPLGIGGRTGSTGRTGNTGRTGRGSGTRSGRYEAAKTNIMRPSLFSTTRMHRMDALRLALLVLIPPLGLVVLWRSGYLLRGKLIFSFLGLSALTLYFTLYLGANMAGPALPPPAPPVAAPTATPTPAPTQPASLALPIQSLEEGEGGQAPAPTLTPRPTKKGQTIVFSVRNNPKLYHKAATCDTQKNARQITLDEAKKEGLKPCPQCKPVK